MAAKKIQARLDDQIFTRQTDRIYTHVVVVRPNIDQHKRFYSEQEVNKKVEEGYFNKYFDFAWCGRFDLVQKQLDRAKKQNYVDVKVLEVSV